MSEQLQLRRGTAAQVAANIPAQGEAWVDTDHNRLVIGDGATSGGWPAPRMVEVAQYAVGAKAVNANVVGDNAMVILLPPGFTRYRIVRVNAFNPSLSLSATFAALYTAASAGGVAVCGPQALSGLNNPGGPGTSGNAIDLTLALPAATFFSAATLFLRTTIAQGAAATFDVSLVFQPLN
jgi:Major tropism determinant N-terminal domain